MNLLDLALKLRSAARSVDIIFSLPWLGTCRSWRNASKDELKP
jgi:hypothetical protein